MVGLQLRCVRVFRQFAGLEVGTVKMALPHPTHQRVTQTVGRLNSRDIGMYTGPPIDDHTTRDDLTRSDSHARIVARSVGRYVAQHAGIA
jgi:hypothetical protein